jgi:2-C-methyl-D-erythritol 4-phosphate cytidylyltransferase/2-C-methyl-D-erythritol 2,4-cyclodiphosphate synthase
MSFSAVIVAAGRACGPGLASPRRGGAWAAAAAALVGGGPARAGRREVVVVVARDRLARRRGAGGPGGWKAVTGGKTRAKSVQAGLAALTAKANQPVLIHDAARPFVTRAHVERLLSAWTSLDGAIPTLPVPDTLKRGDGLVD